ncbi:hypothetical protein ACE6H2_019487 [Prunus campanulata]
MKKVMPPPPPLATTCLAFHSRDDGIVAIGMDNSTIVIYNLHSDEISRLVYTNDGDPILVYPLVMAAHPQKAAQFVVGLSNGELHVLEHLEDEDK